MTHIKLRRAVRNCFDFELEERPLREMKVHVPSMETIRRCYSSVNEIRRAFEEDKNKLEVWSSGRIMFSCEQEPNAKNCSRVKIRCVYCKVRFSYKLIDGLFRLNQPYEIQNEHTHLVEQFADEIEQKIYRYERDSNRLVWLRKKAKREIMTGNPETPPRMFQNPNRLLQTRQMNLFAELQAELECHDISYLTNPAEIVGNEYPHMIVAVSKRMKDNYKRYKDLLSFDITYNLIRNLTPTGGVYRLGVFCVTDTNIRILMAGIALMTDERVEDFCLMFQLFFRLHEGQLPESIITDQQKSIEHAIEKLRHEDYRFGGISHIFDPFHLINNIRENLKGEEEKARASLKLVSQAIHCRSLNQYSRLMTELSKDVENSQLYDQFRDRAEKICYWEIPRSFIGINRFSCEKINDIIKTQIPHETTINILMEKLMRIDNRMHLKSTEGYKWYHEPIEEILGDPRIKPVRYLYERKVFERFLENYTKALFEVEATKELAAQAHDCTYTVTVVDTAETFIVSDWTCSCDEHSKTGVPCSHIIACARKQPKKDYCNLFMARWRKEIPVRSTDKIVMIKRNKPKPDHQYKCKRTLSEYAKKYMREIQNVTLGGAPSDPVDQWCQQ